MATGEHWLATDAFERHLVDALKTSDDYLQDKRHTFNLYQVTVHGKPSLATRLLKPATQLLHPWA